MPNNLSPLDDSNFLNALIIEVLLKESEEGINVGDYDGASRFLENVITRAPECAEAWYFLGLIADRKESLDLAITFLKKCILLSLKSYLVYLYLADTYIRQERIEEAKEIYRYIAQKEEVLKIPEFYLGLSVIERAEGNHTQVKKHLKQYLKLLSKNKKQLSLTNSVLLYEILANCDVEPVLDCAETERKNCKNFMECAERLIKSGKSEKGLPANTPNFLFQLAYYNVNPRPYLEKAAELYRKVFPDLVWTSPHCQKKALMDTNKKIKIGIVSMYLDELHAVGYCLAPLVNALVQSGNFEIIYFKINTPHVSAGFLESVLTIVLPADAKAAREIIASHAIDILWYTDLVMVEQSTLLGHSRLAPIQCVSAGHPVTSGLPTIDYFISSNINEDINAQENYTEKLIKLPFLTSIYPEFHLHNNILKRSHLGLPEEGRIYYCAQTLFKINPAMDDVFKSILEKDQEAYIVFSYAETSYAKQLLTRLEKSLGNLSSRYRFIDRLKQDDFLMLLDMVDVILDSFPFAGGNTTLQSIAVDQPVVTLASSELRGKGTDSTFGLMGIKEVIAKTKEEYVEIALKLAQDKPYRESIRQKIKENKHLIFNQEEVIKNGYVKLFQDLYHQRNLEEYF